MSAEACCWSCARLANLAFLAAFCGALSARVSPNVGWPFVSFVALADVGPLCGFAEALSVLRRRLNLDAGAVVPPLASTPEGDGSSG